MAKFILDCISSIYQVESESKEEIERILNPILNEIINNVNTEVHPCYTWGYHAWIEMQISHTYSQVLEFDVLGYKLKIMDFIHYDHYTRKIYIHYDILTLDEWFDRRKIILREENENKNRSCD